MANQELVASLRAIYIKFQCSEMELLEANDLLSDEFKMITKSKFEAMPSLKPDVFYAKVKEIDSEPMRKLIEERITRQTFRRNNNW